MAKTTSQIIAENKIKRAEAAAIAASRDKIHQQQMAGVAEKSAAKTLAVLNKAISGTSDSAKKSELTKAAQLVTDSYKKSDAQKESGPKTAMDMQKKKEDRIEEKNPVDSLQIKKDRAEKQLSDFENRSNLDWTDAAARELYENQRQKLQAEIDEADAALHVQKDFTLQEQDTADMASMSEDDRMALEQYAVNQIRDQNLPVEMIGKMPTAQQEAVDIIGKYGKQRIDELAESFMRQENAELAEQAEDAGKKLAEDHPVLSSAATVPVNLMAAISGTVGQLQGAARATGRYSGLDPNETGTALDKFSGAVRGQVAQDISGDIYDEAGNKVSDGGALRQLGSYAYQGGMSFLDSTARMLAGGGSTGISSAIAAMGGFSSALQKYSAQGADPAQAILAATASAGIEYITEKLPTEKVMQLFQKGSDKSVVKDILKQAFVVEPLGEEISLFAGVAAETAILGDKSSKAQRIGDLISGGLSKEEAEKQFWKETFQEAAGTYVASAFAGGLGAGGALIGHNQLQEAPADPTMTDPTLSVDQLLEGIQDATPTPAPMPEGLQHFDNAAAIANGMEPVQQTQETAVPEATQEVNGNSETAQSGAYTFSNMWRANAAIEEFRKTDEYQTMSRDQRVQAINEIMDYFTKTADESVPGIAVENSYGNHTSEPDYHDEFEDWGSNAPTIQNDPFKGRSWNEVGKRSVKAYMYENPEVKPYFQMEAQNMLIELANSTRGERTYNEDVHYESGGEKGWSGTKRQTSDGIAELLDSGFTYDEIEKGLNAIIEDNGAENNAASKRIEFVLHKRLSEGHNDFFGYKDTYPNGRVPASEDYVNLINEKQIHTYDNEPVQSAPTVDTQMGASNQSTEGGQIKGTGAAVSDGRIPQTVPADAPGGQRPVTEQAAGIKGTGAAEIDFSGKPAYNATLSEDNSQADRRDDVRPMELPRRDINGNNISAVTGNVYGAGVTPDEFASLMEEPTARGNFSYVPISNNEATQQAMENITRYGWQDAYTQWSNAVHQGRAGAEMSARGALFLNHAAQAGDRQQWLNILSDFQRLGTNTAQGLQAFRILRNLAPSDRLYLMRRSVAQMVEDMHLNVPIEIDQQLADQYQNAPTNEEADAILDEIIDDVAAQIPSTAADRWTALRYVNMLGNMRTQARNISGNIGAKFTYLAKDQIGAALEKVAHAFNPDFQRTKSAWVSNELKALGRADFDEVRDIVLENGRFDDARRFDSTYFAREVNERRRIFRNGFMESYRRLTNWAMNNDHFGDAGFAKAAYARALGGYLKANGFTGDTLEGIDQNLLDDARLYAIQQAQESTFRDHNAVSDWVGRIGRRQDTPRAIRTLSEGVMPFRSTPANVLVRAEEFSPLGIINTAVTAARAANPDTDITGTDVVESMAKTLTGTGLFIMGAYLGKMGMLAGGPDPDDEQAEFDKMNGYQNYALQLGDGQSITIDFLSPLAVPMFLGAELEKIISDGGYDLADFEKVFTSLADPLIQMSMLQGLNDTLDGIKYSENNLGQFFLNASMSYLTQGLTNTLMGQLERSSEENRMTTYVDKDSSVPQWMQQQLGKMSQKIPGWDYQQAEYLNAWGETQKNEGGLAYNLLSPGYISTERSDPITKELNRLHEATGENVFPQTAEKSVNFTDTDGVTHTGYNLSQKEFETMQKVEGQTSYRLMFEVISNPNYAGLTDKQKAAVISDIYSYAREQGLREALPNRFSDAAAWIDDIQGDPENGLIRRATLRVIHEAIENTVNSIENDWSVSPAAKQNLDALYDSFDGLSKEAQKQILDDAVSDTAKYLEIRSHGINTEQYLDVVTDIKDQPLQKGYSQIRDAQTYHAIAENDSLSNVQKDYVMKAYMPDYDPNAKTVDRTELKYDYMIEEGYSRAEFATAYDIYSHEKAVGGEGTADRTRERMCKELDIKMAEAKMLYKLFGGYYKPWE